MTGKHLSAKRLEQLVRRDLTDEQVLKTGWHLLHCKECRQRLEDTSPAGAELLTHLFRGVESKNASGHSLQNYRHIVQRAFHKAEQAVRNSMDQRLGAEDQIEALLAMAYGERIEAIRSQVRFSSEAIAELLLERCRASWASDPVQAQELARLAIAICSRVAPKTVNLAYLADLEAMAWAYLGNTLRIRSQLREATLSFRTAEARLKAGTYDPLNEAEVLDLKASLLRALRRFDEASEALSKAISAYRRTGAHHRVGRALLKKAIVIDYSGQPEKALPIAREAMELIDTSLEPRLADTTAQVFTRLLLVTGRIQEAAAQLPTIRARAAEFGSTSDRLRARWLEGSISWKLGKVKVAEELFSEARDGFIRHDLGYESAMVSLDLAQIYLSQGRTKETKKLAAEMVHIFESRDIHREALAALMVFQKAAEIESATLGVVSDIAGFLQKSRGNPSLRFEKPS